MSVYSLSSISGTVRYNKLAFITVVKISESRVFYTGLIVVNQDEIQFINSIMHSHHCLAYRILLENKIHKIMFY